MDENEISNIVIGEAIKVHEYLGPGLLENVYKECLFYNLLKLGLVVEKEKLLPVKFEDIVLNCGYRIDLLVENKLLVEIKSVEVLHDISFAQLLTYLRLGNYRLGLLINFNVLRLKYGIKRVANGL